MNVAATHWPENTASLDFDRVVGEYYEALRRFALRLAGNMDVATDLAQQTIYLALKHQTSLRDPGRIRSWLHTILHREFLQGIRGEHRHPTRPLEDEEVALPELSPPQMERIDAGIAMTALLNLEPRYRTALALFYLDDLSYREISERLDIPVGTVMSRLSRGKKLLRDQLEAGFDPDFTS